MKKNTAPQESVPGSGPLNRSFAFPDDLFSACSETYQRKKQLQMSYQKQLSENTSRYPQQRDTTRSPAHCSHNAVQERQNYTRKSINQSSGVEDAPKGLTNNFQKGPYKNNQRYNHDNRKNGRYYDNGRNQRLEKRDYGDQDSWNRSTNRFSNAANGFSHGYQKTGRDQPRYENSSSRFNKYAKFTNTSGHGEAKKFIQSKGKTNGEIQSTNAVVTHGSDLEIKSMTSNRKNENQLSNDTTKEVNEMKPAVSAFFETCKEGKSAIHANELQAVSAEVILDVRVVSRLSDELYYVVKENDWPLIEEINKVDRNSLTSPPSLNSLYLCVFDNIGCRARVIRMNPLTVFYPDYGNDEEIDINRLFELPSRWQKQEPLAFKIAVNSKAVRSLQENECARIIKKSNNLWEFYYETEKSSFVAPEKERENEELISTVDSVCAEPANTKDTCVSPVIDPSEDTLVTKTDESATESEQLQKEDDDALIQDIVECTSLLEQTCLDDVAAGKTLKESEQLLKEDDQLTKNLVECTSLLEQTCLDDVEDEFVVGKILKVTIVCHGVYAGKQVYRVICSDKKTAFDELMENLQEEELSPFDVRGDCENGKLYAVSHDDMRYRVRVVQSFITLIEYVDNAPMHSNGVKYLDDDFDVEELLELPAKYAKEDLVPFTIPFDKSIRPTDGTELVIELKELINKFNFWAVDVLDDGADYEWIENESAELLEEHEANGHNYDQMEDESAELLEENGVDGSDRDMIDDESTGSHEEDKANVAVTEIEEDEEVEEENVIENGNDSDGTLIDETSKFDLKSGVRTDVTVVGRGDGEIYKVVATEKKEDYDKLMDELQTEGKRGLRPLSEPCRVGKLYAINRNKIIRRVRVICVDPLRIEFLDGRTDKFDPADLLILLKKFTREELMPLSIKLTNLAQELEPGTEIVVNPVKMIEPRLWFVDLVEDESNFEFETFGRDYHSFVPDVMEGEHSLDYASKDELVTLIMAEKLSDTCVSGIFTSEEMRTRLMLMDKRMNKLKPDTDYKPERGALVIAFVGNTEDEIVPIRALVLKVPTPLFPQYSVFCLDGGYIQTCLLGKFARVSEQFLSMPFTSVLCTVRNGNSENAMNKMEKSERYRIKIESPYAKDGYATGFIMSEDGISPQFEVTLEKFLRPRSGDLLDYVPLKTGDRVSLQRPDESLEYEGLFRSSEIFYIVPRDEDNEVRRMEIVDTVTSKLSKKPLEVDPLRHDMVAVSYGHSWRRAVVLDKYEDGTFRLDMVDFGRERFVHREGLRLLPDYLKTPFRTTVPVQLKNVRITHISYSNEHDRKLMAFLKSERYEFELVIEDDAKVILNFLKDQTYPHEGNYRNVNEFIDDCLTPAWLRFLKTDDIWKTQRFSGDNVQVIHKDWIVGRTLSLFVVVCVTDSIISACNKNGQSYKIFEEMHLDERLEEYCSHFKDPYVPRETEVCITKSKSGVWRRAACFRRKPGKPFEFLFLDTGELETVHQNDIRPMNKDFEIYPISAQVLNVTNADAVDLSQLEGHECTFKMVDEEHVTFLELIN